MNKNKIKKITVVTVSAALALTIVGAGGYKYTKVQAYNKLIETGNKYLDENEYDKAIEAFNQSLDYKDDPTIQGNIKLANNLKKIKSTYDNAIKLMDDKKFTEAIEEFKKVTSDAEKMYIEAQNKIAQCNKMIIESNIELANNAIKDSKFDEANKCLDKIFNIDGNNEEAKQIKDNITKLQKERQEKEKQEQSKKKAVANKKVTYDEAEDIIVKIIRDKEPEITISLMKEGLRNIAGKDYHVVRVFDNMATHTVTRGWYYVEVATGKPYEFDMIKNELKPLN